MRAGKRDRLITIQRRTATPDATWGESGESWSTFATPWASLKPMRGTEGYREGTETKVTHTLEMLYLSGVTNEMRIVWRGQVFDIVSAVRPDDETLMIEANEHPQRSAS